MEESFQFHAPFWNWSLKVLLTKYFLFYKVWNRISTLVLWGVVGSLINRRKISALISVEVKSVDSFYAILIPTPSIAAFMLNPYLINLSLRSGVNVSFKTNRLCLVSQSNTHTGASWLRWVKPFPIFLVWFLFKEKYFCWMESLCYVKFFNIIPYCLSHIIVGSNKSLFLSIYLHQFHLVWIPW